MQMDDFMSHALLWLIGSVVGAGCIGILFVSLVTKSPRYDRPREGRGEGGLLLRGRGMMDERKYGATVS